METAGLIAELGAKVGIAVFLGLAACGIVRRFHLPRVGSTLTRGVLRIVETITLGQHRALHVIAFGERYLLIAVTSSKISLLAEVTTDISSSLNSQQEKEPVTFAAMLTQLLPASADGKGEGQADWLQTAAGSLLTPRQRSASA